MALRLCCNARGMKLGESRRLLLKSPAPSGGEWQETAAMMMQTTGRQRISRCRRQCRGQVGGCISRVPSECKELRTRWPFFSDLSGIVRCDTVRSISRLPALSHRTRDDMGKLGRTPCGKARREATSFNAPCNANIHCFTPDRCLHCQSRCGLGVGKRIVYIVDGIVAGRSQRKTTGTQFSSPRIHRCFTAPSSPPVDPGSDDGNTRKKDVIVRSLSSSDCALVDTLENGFVNYYASTNQERASQEHKKRTNDKDEVRDHARADDKYDGKSEAMAMTVQEDDDDAYMGGGKIWEEMAAEDDDDEEDYDDDDDEDGDDDEDEDEYALDFEGPFEDESGEEAAADVMDSEGERIKRSFSMADRVFELREKVLRRDGRDVSVDEVQQLFGHPIDKFQKMSISAFLEGLSVVVCAPTSSGKTLIAEAAAAVALARGKRLIYTTPLKALSNQKLREFRIKFGIGNVGLLTGDATVNRDAPILVMTTEILRNMMYSSLGGVTEGSGLSSVDVIVLDEVHYLSDISRGTVWEESVIYCPDDVQLICLSATVANSDELADWIAQVHGPTELITSTKRPVPLMWHFSMRHSLVPLLNSQGNAMNRSLRASERLEDVMEEEPPSKRTRRKRKTRGRNVWDDDGEGWGDQERINEVSEEERKMLRRKLVPQLRDTLQQLKERDMLPAIWFLFSRRGCDQALAMLYDVQLLREEERRAVGEAIAKFRESNPEAVRESSVKPLMRGIASHHAGCLPAWKAFVEELFQGGLVKVVFATETLAAGVNMPARTTVLSALMKRGDNGHQVLAANAMLQMAGRAGRRGIDRQGHVVVVQTPFQDPDDCCTLLFGGADALVSQFTATYGMVLNLLRGGVQPQHYGRAIPSEADGGRLAGTTAMKMGRTMDEARSLVERSFGNYVGSEVMGMAKKNLRKIEQEIDDLKMQQKQTIDTMRDEPQAANSAAWKRYAKLKENLKTEKRSLRAFRERIETLRLEKIQPLLDELERQKEVPVLELRFKDHATQSSKDMSVLYVGKIPRPFFVSDEGSWEEDEAYEDELTGLTALLHAPDMVEGHRDGEESNAVGRSVVNGVETPVPESRPGSAAVEGGFDGRGSSEILDVNGDGFDGRSEGMQQGIPDTNGRRAEELGYYVGLGQDNNWYVFTAKYVVNSQAASPEMVEFGSKRVPLREELQDKLRLGSRNWSCKTQEKSTGSGDVWMAQGSFDTWLWSASVPLAGTLPLTIDTSSAEMDDAEREKSRQRTVVAKARKRMKSMPEYKQEKQILHAFRRREQAIKSLDSKAAQLAQRIENMAPTGWKEFVQVVRVLDRLRAIDMAEEVLLPLGEMAATLRGTNELWLAIAFSDRSLQSFTSPQLASVCAILVSDIKVRSDFGRVKEGLLIYRPSPEVLDWLEDIESKRLMLLDTQFKEGVQIPVEMDEQFAGMVEAWASGVSWTELMMGTTVDEGDIARLLRRTIDLLVQVRHLPHIDNNLKKLARNAATMMDRPPISELIG